MRRGPVAGKMPEPRATTERPAGRPVQDYPGENAFLEQGHRWLRAQKADHYTLQIFASNDRGSVLRFINDHRFDRQVAVYAFTRNGVSWFGVVYGRFDTVRDAHLAVDGLPSSIRRAHPWVRAFREIQPFLKK
jgi:septal ring-binding cell division protein DamX